MVLTKKVSCVGVVKRKNKPANFEEVNYEILNVKFKESETDCDVTYAYKLKVKNNASKDIDLIGKFIFKDNDGFEVESGFTDIFVVSALREHVELGKICIYNKEVASRITNIDTLLKES